MQVLHLKTYTWLEPGEYHAVLLCNTSKGWFVLDNRYNWPMTPKSLPYRWDKALDEVDGKWYEFSVS
jgi:predicted transglutaminase-like cysteine proteinase